MTSSPGHAGGNRSRAWWTLRRVHGVALLLGLTALSTYNAVTTDRFVADLAITRWVQQADLGPVRGALLWMGLRGVAGAVVVAMSAWLWLRGRRLEAVYVVILLVPDVSSFILRDLYDRPRPAIGVVNVYGGPQGASYPSGTAMHYMLFFGFAFYLIPRLGLSRRWAAFGRGLCVFWIFLMGLWVIHHGRHWPSDVIGGYLYGALFLVLMVRLYDRAKGWESRHPAFLWNASPRRIGALLGMSRAP